MSDLLNSASLVLIPSGYKEDVVYSPVPTDGSGDLSFTRASNGTRVNSAGLVEDCPWNLAQQSETFDNAGWVKVRATITANDITAPNGTLTADKLSANATLTSSFFFVSQDVITNAIIGQPYTATLYAKAGTVAQMMMYLGAQNGIYWNLSNGQFISYYNGVQNITSYNSESVGDGWYKFTISMNATITTIPIESYSAKSGSIVANYTTADNYYLWGAQLNIGATAKPYFPTTDRLNVPRLTYQNGGGGCPSLLLEKQSTNIVSYSEQFDNVAYTVATNNGSLTRTANYGFSPDGTQNADRLQMSITPATNNYSQLYQLLTVTSGQTYTWSVYIKSLSGTPTIGWAYDGSNWQNITVTTEWVRYTRTATATSININADFLLYHNIGTSSSADILVWGYQIEQSSYPTSYIPTTSSSATRVADECYKTGISSLIGQTEGVMFCDFNITEIEPDPNYLMVANLSDNSLINRLGFSRVPSGGIHIYVIVSGASQFTFNTTQTTGRFKLAITYKANDYAVYLNGTSIYTNTSAPVPSSMSRFDLGNLLNSFQSKVTINEAVIFKTRLTNAELASLTTI